jgi:hypothetical protein
MLASSTLRVNVTSSAKVGQRAHTAPLRLSRLDHAEQGVRELPRQSAQDAQCAALRDVDHLESGEESADGEVRYGGRPRS